MRRAEFASKFTALDERFRAAAEGPTGGAILAALYPLAREAGRFLFEAVEADLLPAPDGMLPHTREQIAEERRRQTLPSNLRQNRSDAESLFLDPYARLLNLYGDQVLSGVVDLPGGGFSRFDSLGLDESHLRVVAVGRAQALSGCCAAMARHLRTGNWEGIPPADGVVRSPSYYAERSAAFEHAYMAAGRCLSRALFLCGTASMLSQIKVEELDGWLCNGQPMSRDKVAAMKRKGHGEMLTHLAGDLAELVIAYRSMRAQYGRTLELAWDVYDAEHEPLTIWKLSAMTAIDLTSQITYELVFCLGSFEVGCHFNDDRVSGEADLTAAILAALAGHSPAVIEERCSAIPNLRDDLRRLQLKLVHEERLVTRRFAQQWALTHPVLPDFIGASLQDPREPVVSGQRSLGAHKTASKVKSEVTEQLAVVRREGTVWFVAFGGVQGWINDVKGMGTIAELLARPHPSVPLTAIALMSGAVAMESVEHGADLISDAAGRAAIREALASINAEIDKARESGSEEALERAVEKKEHLQAEIRANTKLGGKSRRLGPNGSAERARLAVKRRLSSLYKKLRDADPPLIALAEHLEASIKTEGTAYAYRPAGDAPDWELGTVGS